MRLLSLKLQRLFLSANSCTIKLKIHEIVVIIRILNAIGRIFSLIVHGVADINSHCENFFPECGCSLHVNGNYWQTGWESQNIELRQSFIFLNQLQPLATYKLLVSLGSGSVKLISPYKLFVINLLRITLSSCTAFTLCTLSIPPALEYLVSSLEGC